MKTTPYREHTRTESTAFRNEMTMNEDTHTRRLVLYLSFCIGCESLDRCRGELSVCVLARCAPQETVVIIIIMISCAHQQQQQHNPFGSLRTLGPVGVVDIGNKTYLFVCMRNVAFECRRVMGALTCVCACMSAARSLC